MPDRAFAGDAFFLGPHSENAAWVRGEFQAILDHWFEWRRSLFQDDPTPISAQRRLEPEFLAERERMGHALRNLCQELCAEVPKYTPRYVGHMVSEISLPALFGHMATLLHNPNNTSREVARVSGRIEDEGIAMLAKMIGYDPARAQGHFTGGGTMANFEAVWRARYRMDHFLSMGLWIAEQTGEPLDVFSAAHMGWRKYAALAEEYKPGEDALKACSTVLGNPFELAERIGKASGRPWRGPVLITPGNKHFSWRKAANIFGLGENSFRNAPLDRHGRLDPDALDKLIEAAREDGRPVLAVVTVAGTTEAGEIDPVDVIADRLEARRADGCNIWHHVDAAYGGYLCSMLGGDAERVLAPRQRDALAAIGRVDSVTLDPHKLGYVPYACGAFLTRDTKRYCASSFQAPYIDRAITNDRWSSTLEGSRSGAGAAAVWLTGKAMGYGPDRFGAMLAQTVETRWLFEEALSDHSPNVRLLKPADSNILCFSLAEEGDTLSQANARTAKVYAAFQEDPEFSVSKTVLSAESYDRLISAHVDSFEGDRDTDQLVLMRCVFMNPFWAHPAVKTKLLPHFLDRLSANSHGVVARQ
jgi:glutamate/tyrosine decarboxylase-like PLP-dependent enzyme